MPVISVITAVHPAASQYLTQTARSLENQTLPTGWDLEWLICVDAESTEEIDTPRKIEIDVKVLSPGRRLGPGGCRNTAAVHAQGRILRNLDADDQLLGDALATDIHAIRDSGYEWTTSEAIDLMSDGSQVAFAELGSTDVHIPPGGILQQWRENSILKVHPATLAITADLFWETGGYAALPISEDVAFLSRANRTAAGLHRADPTLLYRKWEGQITAAPRTPTWRLIREKYTTASMED